MQENAFFHANILTKSPEKKKTASQYWYGGVAQGLEQWNHNPCVGCSNHPTATNFRAIVYYENGYVLLIATDKLSIPAHDAR